MHAMQQVRLDPTTPTNEMALSILSDWRAKLIRKGSVGAANSSEQEMVIRCPHVVFGRV